jgi:hypothetical protein
MTRVSRSTSIPASSPCLVPKKKRTKQGQFFQKNKENKDLYKCTHIVCVCVRVCIVHTLFCLPSGSHPSVFIARLFHDHCGMSNFCQGTYIYVYITHTHTHTFAMTPIYMYYIYIYILQTHTHFTHTHTHTHTYTHTHTHTHTSFTGLALYRSLPAPFHS